MSKYFIVATHGRTASHWLSANLNKHPDIICNHGCFGGTVEPIINFSQHGVDDRNIEEIRLQAEPAWESMTIENRFERLKCCGEAEVYGTVHGDLWHQLGFRIKKEKPAIKIKAVNVVRHPVPRIVSCIKEWLKEESQSPATTKQLERLFTLKRRFVSDVEKQFDIDFDDVYNKRFVLALVQILERDARDLCLPGWHIPMERLTRDSECFLWLLSYITDDAVDISPGYIEEVMSSGRTNFSSKGREVSREIFEKWEEWKKELFVITLKRLDFFNLYENYLTLNYDLSFCIKGEYDIRPGLPDLFLPLDSGPGNRHHREYGSVGKYKLLWEENKREEIAEVRRNSVRREQNAYMRGYIRGFIKFNFPPGKKVALYGAGSHTKIFLEELKRAGIRELPVVLDGSGFDHDTVDTIIISSRSFEADIYEKLLNMGVPPDKLVRLYE